MLEADVLTIAIADIANPRSQAFVVTSSVGVVGKDGGRYWRNLGALGPYPSDRSGTFTLVIPDDLRTLFSQERARLVIVMRLSSTSAERTLEAPLRVVLGSVSVESSTTPSPTERFPTSAQPGPVGYGVWGSAGRD